MISDFIKSFDIFSQPIQFNSSKQTLRKRTYLGAFLSVCIIGVSFTYFFYLTYLYLGNQVEPKYRSQSFITNEDIDIHLENDYFAFQLKEYRGAGNLETLQAKANKTYIIFLAFYQFTNTTGFFQINLDISPCKNPNLERYNCLDYSKVPDQKITTGNINNIFSQITIFAYKCQDVDYYKTTIPDNCAAPEEIDAYIANLNNLVSVKLFTSQFNTTSQQMQVNYRHQYAYMSIKYVQFLEYKAKKSVTVINSGPLIQHEQKYMSPITYTVNSQGLDLQTVQQSGFSMFMQLIFDVDESVSYIDIQYPTYPEILAQINSALAIMMGLGVLARYMAQNLIKEELFILILKTFYQQTFFKMLQLNKIDQFSDIFQLDQIIDRKTQESDDQEPIQVPQLLTKSCFQKLSLYSSQVNSIQDQPDQKDEVLEEFRNEQSPFDPCRKSNGISDRSEFQKAELVQLTNFKQPTLKLNEQGKKQRINKKQNKNEGSCPVSLINSPVSTERKLNPDFNQITIQDQQNNLINQKNEIIERSIELRQDAKNNLDICKSLEKVLFKFKLFDKKKYVESVGIDQNMNDCILGQINQSLDFLSFYNEVLLLKKAIMMILSEDQFAALQMIGASQDYFKGIDIEQEYKLNQSFSKKTNHFQKQLFIQKSSQMQIKQIKQFIEKCNENQNLTEIDKRIYYSIV